MRESEHRTRPDTEPVEVRTDSLDEPQEFLWRGRLWQVRAIVARWVDQGPWWATPQVRSLVGAEGSSQEALDAMAVPGGVITLARLDTLAEREVWRVEAFVPRRPARPPLGPDEPGDGVFDLTLAWRSGCWRLAPRSA